MFAIDSWPGQKPSGHHTAKGTVMDLSALPAHKLSHGAPEDFPAGTILFTPYTWFRPEPFQVGVRVGAKAEIFALSEWYDGQAEAGTIVEAQTGMPVFGLRPDAGLPTVMLNPRGHSIGYDNAGRVAGLVGLGKGGLFLIAKAPRSQLRGVRFDYAIDPKTWLPAEIAQGDEPQAWIDDWSLRIPLSDVDSFVIAIDRSGNQPLP